MELWYAPTSPFARKVRIAAAELDMSGQMELVAVNPWSDARLRRLNPICKVPTLVVDDGLVLFESAVICDYLDAFGDERHLFPVDGPQRWRALLLQGLADAAMTSIGRLFADESRPPDQRSEFMMSRFAEARDSALDMLEQEYLRDEPTIGEIAVAAMLSYLDFRWPDRYWRQRRSNLSSWFENFNRRPSMTSTTYGPSLL